VHEEENHLASDLLNGADKIGTFLGWSPKRVYRAASQNEIPTAKMAGRVTASKSVLRSFLARELGADLTGGKK
jgi:hypothetical protein